MPRHEKLEVYQEALDMRAGGIIAQCFRKAPFLRSEPEQVAGNRSRSRAEMSCLVYRPIHPDRCRAVNTRCSEAHVLNTKGPLKSPFARI